jgi:uncharacterized protein YndB with AHSA1/START domain
MNEKWTSFTLTANFTAPVSEVYRVWATQRGIEKWFLRKAIYKTPEGDRLANDTYVRAGDSFEWYWHGFPDTVAEKGRILEANHKDRFSFTFTGDTIVTVHIYTRESETMLELTQGQIPVETDPEKSLYVQCSHGWLFYLTNLKSYLEGGLDLRNKSLAVKSHFK